MSENQSMITTDTKKLYFLSCLADLRPLYQDVVQTQERYAELDKLEKNSKLYEDESLVDEYINIGVKLEGLKETCHEWWENSVSVLGVSDDEFLEKTKELFGSNKKKRAQSDGKELDIFEKLKSLGALVSSNLWNNNGKGCLASSYINALAKYMCAPESIKSAALDWYVTERAGRINEILPRDVSYKSAQAVLLEKIHEIARSSKMVDENAVVSRYCGDYLMQEASTRGADNHLFRCLASGRFYIPENERQASYSDFFVKNYGKKFSVNPNLEARKTSQSDVMTVNDILQQVAATYDKVTAEDLENYILSRGVSKGDFSLLNAYDLSKIMQKPGAALNGLKSARNLDDISRGCPPPPYQKFARRLGMMLEIGKKAGGKTEGDYTIKAGSFRLSKNVWEKDFAEDYSKYSDFLKDCGNIYCQLKADFENNGYGAFFEKWTAEICETGRYNADIKGAKAPFEINIHHKIPVKLAKNLDNPAEINSNANYLMFIEYNAPTGDKLTKHLQEHAKENAATGRVPETPDKRWLVTSGNVSLENKNYRDPASIAKLRQQSKVKEGQVKFQVIKSEKELV